MFLIRLFAGFLITGILICAVLGVIWISYYKKQEAERIVSSEQKATKQNDVAYQNDAVAQNNLGHLLEKEGKIEEAKAWLAQAASQGHRGLPSY